MKSGKEIEIVNLWREWKKAWDDIYENSTMSAQTLRDNAAIFHKDNSSLKLIIVRDRTNVEPEGIIWEIAERKGLNRNEKRVEKKN